jgi:hypothetical protein
MSKRKWSQETIRRRGVRVVVAALRLKKEHEQLSSVHAGHITEKRSIEASLKNLASRNDALRKAIKQRNGGTGLTQKTSN